MIEQLSDSGFNSGGAGDSSLTYTNEKQLPVVVKKQALRNLPNENNVNITKSIDDSTLQKERVPVKDPDNVSGTKRLSSEINLQSSQPPSAVNTNGNLVYVRRKIEVEVGNISSSGIAGNNTDVQLSVNVPVSDERLQPSSTQNKSRIDAGNASGSSKPSPNSPALLVNMQSESSCPDPPKAGTILTSSEDTSLLSHPVGKLSSTVSSAENKSLLTHPVGISGNTVSFVVNKSPHPHSVGVSVNSMVSIENKTPLHPLGKFDTTISISATENKSLAQHPLGSSDAAASLEIELPLPHSVRVSGVISSAENRSQIPSLGKSGNIVSSAENNCIPPASLTTKVDVTKELNGKPLQQWHVHPMVSLRGLDRSVHGEYLQMLRSLSSVELSRLAFELEARSIQLSFEEAREMARVEMLNVMGKFSKPCKSPITLLEK